ncbi:MAG: ABC-2 family transporter protein [Deltaproteobacteria bacterium]|nr:ABC-2 family transporter protein [Deltaproteobacteria bacterium]
MRPYLAIFKARFRALLQYRAAAAAGLLTQVFWGFVRIMIFTAFYTSSTAPKPMALAELITYVWLTQAILRLLPWQLDGEIEQIIRDGNVAYELMRPVDVYGLWYARAFALRTAPVLLRSVPMLVPAYLLFGMGAPASPTTAVAFVLSVTAAAALSAALTTLLSVAMLVTISGRGLHTLTLSVVNLMSGAIVPLSLLPDWFQPTLEVLPFRGLLDTPIRIYLGHLPAEAIAGAIGHQLLWTILIAAAGRAVLRRALRNVVVHGG